jgi:hypothetical protein
MTAMLTDSRYAVGQVWTFADAPLPESRTIIGALDDVEGLGLIVSICVTGMPVRDPASGGTQILGIDHAPMMPEGLDACLLENVGSSEPTASFEQLRKNWLSSIASDGAGAFSIGVAELVGLYQTAIQKSLSSEQ